MPRKRKTTEAESTGPIEGETPDEVVVDEVKVELATATPVVASTTERTYKIMALTPDQIKLIYANRRTKGQYEKYLTEFLASSEDGISVKEVWPTLADKKASTLKQGFDNAKDRKEAPEGSEFVDIIVDGENVYLMNVKALTDNGVLDAVEAPAQTEDAEAEPVEA